MGTGSGPPSSYIMQHNQASGLDAGNLPGGGSVNVSLSSSSNPSGSAGLFGSSLSQSEPPNLDKFDQQETLQHQRQKLVLPSQLSEKQQPQSQQVHQRYQQQLFQPGQPAGQRQGLGSAQDLQEQQAMRLRTMQQFQGRTFDSMGGSQQQVRPAQPLTYLQLEASANDRLVSDQEQQQQILVRRAETKIGDDMQHQVLQHGLKRPYSMLSPHLLSQESLKLQRQTPQQFQVPPSILQQRLLQRQHQLQLLAQHLRQEQHQSQHQSHQQFAGVQTLPASKQSAFEPGACARRLMQYVYHQRHRPSDNNIGFWRKFVAEYFVPSAKKRWCVSQYGSADRLPTGVFPQDVWQCEICGSKPSRGFETSVEILPRLCKIKYDSGILEDLLFVDLPHEYRLNSGIVVLEYGKAIQESVFEQLRVVRDGQLRITFSHDLKILSWEFCARSHEELLCRRSILPQVTQLAAIAQKYQTSVKESGEAGLPLHDLQSSCQSFVASSRHLARNLEVPTVNDFGYTKRYVRCLQISEVVNSMKDLIDFSRENGMGPIACLENFPRISSTRLHNSSSQQQDQLSLPALVSEEKNTSSSEQCNDNENEDLASGLDATVSDLGSEANVPQDLPRLGHQNSISSLELSFQNTASKPFVTDLSDKLMHCTEMDSGNYGSSLQTSFSASGTPESSIMSNLSTSGNQNPLNSSANLLQHRSAQSHIVQHASDNPAHTFKEMMLSPQGNSGGQFEQMLGRITPSSLGNNGIGCSVGGFMNGLRGSGGSQVAAGKVENNISFGQTGIGKVENSISFVGNRNTNILGRSYGSSTNGGGNLLTGLGGSMRNGGSGISAIGNSNFMNGARTFPSADQHQYIQLQNPGIELHDNLARNGLFNNVGSSGGFGNLQFS